MKVLITQLKSKLTNADFVTNLLVILMLLLAGLESISAQCPTPQGDPKIYGAEFCIGYVYLNVITNNQPQNVFSGTDYRGYISQTEQFSTNIGSGSVASPNVCDRFVI